MNELQNGIKTNQELNENTENQLFAYIQKEYKDGESILTSIESFESDGGIIENPARIYKQLIKQYPDQEKDLKKWAISKNKAFINSTSNYLKRKQEKDKNKYYNCSVFMQTVEKKPQPLKIPQGTLSYIGAMTHRGKTTALISITIDALLQGHKVYFVTTEETPDQIIDRMIKAIVYINFKEINNIFHFNSVKNRYEIKTIKESELNDRLEFYLSSYEPPLQGTKDFNKEPPKNLQECIFRSYEILNDLLESNKFVILDHTQQRSFDELTDALELLEEKSVIVLDYIQHVKKPINAGSDNRQVIIQNQSQQLSDLAGHKDFIIIAGGQFNRKGNDKNTEQDKFKPDFLDPTLFRESGDIEQDAHLIIGIGQQLHESDTEETVSRFYEILKQRGVKADTNKYLIIDNASYSLYSCSKRLDQNKNVFLDYFKPAYIPVTKRNGKNKNGQEQNENNQVNNDEPLFTMNN